MSKAAQIVQERILEALEEGTVPWRYPWRTRRPVNLATKRPYRGVNILLLGLQGFASPWWLTFNQAKRLGGHVRKGEKASKVVFWKILKRDVEDPATGEPVLDDDGEVKQRKVPMLRFYNVFNAEQCEGLDDKIPAEGGHVVEGEPDECAQAVWDNYPDKPSLVHAGSRCFYDPVKDVVQVPPVDEFCTYRGYYQSLFHEAVHSTGHAKRLNRPELVDDAAVMGTESYSREELVAEIGACMLMAEAGLEPDIQNSAAYVEGWMRRIADDPMLVVWAASRAEKAADHILVGWRPENLATATTHEVRSAEA